MKRIPLTQGLFAIVDDEDFEWLNQWKWSAFKSRYSYYAQRNQGPRKKQKTILMHRQILNAQKGQITDHKEHNGLDNRKENIRICTPRQNSQNSRKMKKGSSIYKGVIFHIHKKKWMAQIYHKGINKYLGYFDSEIKAAKVYNKMAKELFGKFACLNNV